MKRIYLLLTMAFVIATINARTQSEIASELAHRLLGDRADEFIFKEIPKDKKAQDIFTVESRDNRIEIGGNNANSMAAGLNYYLKNYAGTTVSWYKDDAVFIPDSFPRVPSPVKVKSRVNDRFFLNYCTFGYTMPWWKWADWERFIDWMALNGINMPLAITGQEAVWYNVWKSMGMTDTEIRSYFTGPAHLPWHRMCNIDGWQGPLPMEWIEKQAALQSRIVNRERELGMKPVLPAFSGHVPALLKKYHPEANTHAVGDWNKFDPQYQCTFLYANDPLFTKIQRQFLEEQTRLYGTDHIYGVDCFNEVAPPSWQPDSLREIGRTVMKSMTDVDPKAKWLQMTWLFYYDKNWTPERIKAYLSGVPRGKMILLDYYCDNIPLWEKTERFHGHDYIWCFLGNFGGTSFLKGDPRETSRRIEKVAKEGGKNFTGIGSTLEGFDVNPYLYEFVFDKAWERHRDDDATFEALAYSRTGKSPKAQKAWKILIDSVYTERTGVGHATLNNSRPCLTGVGCSYVKNKYKYRNSTLTDAWGLLLECDGEGRDSYEYDVVNIGRQAIGNYFTDLRDDFNAAYKAKDIKALEAKGAEMCELLNDMTDLMACHPTFSLRRWLEDARSMTDDPAQRDYYDENARTLITYWGGNRIFDYANRAYAELNDQFYAPRWQRFIEQVTADVKAGRKFNQKEFNRSISEFEHNWTVPSRQRIHYLPDGDGVAVAKRLYKKYAPLIRAREK